MGKIAAAFCRDPSWSTKVNKNDSLLERHLIVKYITPFKPSLDFSCNIPCISFEGHESGFWLSWNLNAAITEWIWPGATFNFCCFSRCKLISGPCVCETSVNLVIVSHLVGLWLVIGMDKRWLKMCPSTRSGMTGGWISNKGFSSAWIKRQAKFIFSTALALNSTEWIPGFKWIGCL